MKLKFEKRREEEEEKEEHAKEETKRAGTDENAQAAFSARVTFVDAMRRDATEPLLLAPTRLVRRESANRVFISRRSVYAPPWSLRQLQKSSEETKKQKKKWKVSRTSAAEFEDADKIKKKLKKTNTVGDWRLAAEWLLINDLCDEKIINNQVMISRQTKKK